MSDNHFPQRPCEVAPHSTMDRLERLISEDSRQLIDSNYVSQKLGITKHEAAGLLKGYMRAEAA